MKVVSSTLLYTLSTLVALSGWGKISYDYLSGKPKIRGQVFQVMRGQMSNPEKPGEFLASFTTYLYLVNQRKNTIHILDYELEVEIKRKWYKLQRVYGIHKVSNLTFLGEDNREIKIDNFSQNLIYRKNSPVEFGVPLHGWIVFAGTSDLYRAEISRYRLVCIDAFRNRHTVITSAEKLANLYLLQDLAGIEFSKTSQQNNP